LYLTNELVQETLVKVIADSVIDEPLLGGWFPLGLIAKNYIVIPATLQ
jgi:hypothetical protein